MYQFGSRNIEGVRGISINRDISLVGLSHIISSNIRDLSSVYVYSRNDYLIRKQEFIPQIINRIKNQLLHPFSPPISHPCETMVPRT